MKPRAAISWSGGKDCCTALLRTHRDYDVIAMITMFAEDGARSRSHGLRPEVLTEHAQRLGLRNLTGRCSWRSYTGEYIRLLGEASAMGITHIIFGDIMGDAHRAWDEGVCAVHRLTAVLPLWGESTRSLVEEFIGSRSTAVIVTARSAYLDATWLGRSISLELIEELESHGVDPCGEFGEYHTLVTSTPLFNSPLDISFGARELHSDCWALDVVLSTSAFPGPPPASPKPTGGGGKPPGGEGGSRINAHVGAAFRRPAGNDAAD